MFESFVYQVFNRNNNNLHISKTAMLKYSRSKTQGLTGCFPTFFPVLRLQSYIAEYKCNKGKCEHMLPLYVEMTLFFSSSRTKGEWLTKRAAERARICCGLLFLQFPDEATPLISCQSACLCGPISVRLTSTTVTCRTCGTFKKSQTCSSS